MSLDQVGALFTAVAFTAGTSVTAIALYVGVTCLWDAWVEWHAKWQVARESRQHERLQAEAVISVFK